MSSCKRFLIGGIGGLAPILMFLITVDWEHYIADAAALKVLGYCVRVIVLFLIGGFVAYLHSDEEKPFKLFELGLAAPALIAGYITTSLVPTPTTQSIPSTRAHANFAIVGVAFAQSEVPSRELKRFSLPVQSAKNQFLEGLIGGTPQNVWFVIVGSHLRREDAEAQANSINEKYRNFKAEVYEPYGEHPYFSVVIGANLTQSEAKALRDKAVKEGLPKDSYYKTFPNLPPPSVQR